MDISRKILSDIIVFTKYARFDKKKKRRETWEEIIDRYKKMMTKKYPELKEEIEENCKYLYEKKVLPSMRCLQFAEKSILRNHSSGYNCSYVHMHHPDAFSEVMFLLLSGCGVGYSVQIHHIDQLPEIVKPKKTRKFLISDSLEGWAESIKVLINSYMTPRKSLPMFDFSDIRPKGAELKTSGGKAPGPAPLKTCLHHIQTILDSKKDGEKLTTIEVHDINCHIADAVLSGGIRRSAMIALFSFNDPLMREAKVNRYYEQNPQRDRANNSAVILRHKITEEEFFKYWELIKENRTGEPGIFFTNDQEIGTNPSLRAGTRIYTTEGIFPIEQLEGKEIEVHNLDGQISKAKCFLSSSNAELYEVGIGKDQSYFCTKEHSWPIIQTDGSIKKVATSDLKIGDKMPIIQRNKLFVDGKIGGYETGYAECFDRVKKLPSSVWSSDCSEEYRVGCINAVLARYGSGLFNFEFSNDVLLNDVVDLLGFYGIKCGVNNTKVEILDKKQFLYVFKHLQIDEYNNTEPYRIITKISKTGVQEPVWDITVYDNTHCFQLSRCVTGNCGEISLPNGAFCNLTELNISNVKDQTDYENRCKVASFFGTLQAGFTDFHFLRELWKEATEKHALIGVSMTGLAGATNDLDYTKGAQVVKEENERIANLIGTNKAARCCTIKPSGTASLVLGCSPGIHTWHASYYVRRVRLSKDESIYKYLSKHHPELIEDDFFHPNTQAIVSIPIKAPEGAITRDETALQFLGRVKKVFREWIKPGHRKGHNYNNISCTVSIKPHEWERVGKWMWENREHYTAISVLPYDDHVYKQAPFEEITEEKYNELIKYLKQIDLSNVIEEQDNTKLQGEVACGGSSSCMITEL